MSDLTSLGHEFTTWISERVGDTCPSCQSELEYRTTGIEDGQSTHRVECDCTFIQTGSNNGKSNTVVVSEYDSDYYHESKKGFYTECGSDFNPHHATNIEVGRAAKLGYDPCPDCREKTENTEEVDG